MSVGTVAFDQRVLGRRIREARTTAGLSQGAVGELCGVSKSAVYQWESACSMPDARSVAIVARRCACSADWLLGLVDDKRSRYSGDPLVLLAEAIDKARKT